MNVCKYFISILISEITFPLQWIPQEVGFKDKGSTDVKSLNTSYQLFWCGLLKRLQSGQDGQEWHMYRRRGPK